MYRVFIKDNDTPQFNYPTPVVKYLCFEDIKEDYDVIMGKWWMGCFKDSCGEGDEYQLGIL